MDANAKNHLTAVFKLLDIDGSGFIEEAEGMKVGKALGYTPVFEYWEELKKLDTDGGRENVIRRIPRGKCRL